MSAPLLIMVAILIGASVAGMPIGVAMIVSSIIYLLITGRDLGLAGEQVLNGLYTSYVTLAVPLFIFAANIMNAGTITTRLLNFSLALVGRLPGGLAQVNVLTSLIFSGMSGSAVSDAAGVGKVITSMMMANNRYPPGYAGAVTAASAIIGPIFPPSIPMVLYALISSTSVGALFLGGMLPALILCGAMMVLVWIQAVRRKFPTEEAIPLAAYPLIFLRAIPPLLMPVLLLGGIYSGAFTPTEAAAVSALYALILSGICYRELGLRGLFEVVVSSARTTAVVTMIIAGAFIFNYVVAIEQVPAAVAGFFNALNFNAPMFLFVINLLYLVLGCFLSTATIMLVVTPLFIPTAMLLGIDLVHFGVVVVINMMIGLVTPPFGVLLFVIRALNGIRLSAMIKESWIFLALMITCLFLFTYVPEIVLALPRWAGLVR